MKRVLYLLTAAAMLFGAASCQREILPDGVTGDVNVRFNVELPAGVSTKAIADGTNVDILYYEIYNDKMVRLASGTKERTSEKTFEFDLTLVSDQTYNFLFWAHVDGKDFYDLTGGLQAVKVNYTYTDDEGNVKPYPANDESRAAFFAKETFTVTESFKATVELKRPFAQLNFGTSTLKSDLSENDVLVSGSKVTVSSAATVFNVAAGVGSVPTTAEVVFDAAAIPSDPKMLEVAGKNYYYLSMNYFLVDGEKNNVEVTAELATDFGTVTREVVEVPVAENHRTNIVGDLLFNKADLKIIVDEKFVKEDNNILLADDAVSLQEAIDNASDGGEVKLMQDVGLNELFNTLVKSGDDPQFFTVPKGKNIVLDLNGYSITGVDETEKNFGLIQNNGTLSIINTADNNSKISLVATKNSGSNRYSAVISNNPGGVLTIGDGVVIEHHGGTDMAYGIDILTNGGIGDVRATIDGAVVKSTYRAVRQFLNSDSKENALVVKSGSELVGENQGLFFHDPSKKANRGKLIVEEGAVVSGAYLYVTAGSTEWPVEVSIAASALPETGPAYANVPALYEVVLKDGFWIVAVSAEDEGTEM